MRRRPYQLELESRVDPGPDVYRFRSADGVVSKDEFRPAELRLLSAVESRAHPMAEILVVDANWGLLPTVLAHLSASVTATETSARAAELCRQNARANDADVDVRLVADVGDIDRRFDLAVYAPRPYDPIVTGTQKISDALDLVRSGGDLLVAAGPHDGSRRYRGVMDDLAGEVERLQRAKGVACYRASRPPDYSRQQFVEPQVIEATVAGHHCEFCTRPGLFSSTSIDRGTALLAETIVSHRDRPPDRVLDAACGYGPLGTVLAHEYDPELWFSDDSRVATSCARESANRNAVDPAGVVTADCLAGVEGPFDLIVTNPPTHAGTGVTDELFSAARRALATSGELWLVYNEPLGYEDTLTRSFGAVRTVRRTDGYVITVAQP